MLQIYCETDGIMQKYTVIQSTLGKKYKQVLHTFYIGIQVGSVHNYLGGGFHLQVPPQPCGLLQRRACNCPNGLHHLMSHVLSKQVKLRSNI